MLQEYLARKMCVPEKWNAEVDVGLMMTTRALSLTSTRRGHAGYYFLDLSLVNKLTVHTWAAPPIALIFVKS